MIRTLLLAAALAIAACASSSSSSKRAPTFQPSESSPVRVAVLPFRDATGGVSPFLYPALPLIWLANVITLRIPEGTPDSAKGAATMRALLIARLRYSRLDVVDPGAVDTTLAHRGLLERASEMDPRDLGRALGVDAVMYGTLESWSTRYYLIESRTVVEGTVRLRSAVDGSDLFQGTVAVNDAEGITGGPTGYIGLAATPLAALGAGPYRQLAIAWAGEMGMLLGGPIESDEPQGPEPYVTTAVVHDPPPGGYKPDDVIEVFAIGATDCTATFDIGTLRVRIPMTEFARVPRTGEVGAAETSGQYRGSYVVREVDRVNEAPVTVTLETSSGRVATFAASGKPVTIAAADPTRRDAQARAGAPRD